MTPLGVVNYRPIANCLCKSVSGMVTWSFVRSFVLPWCAKLYTMKNGQQLILQWCHAHTQHTSGSGTTSLAWTYMKVCRYSDSFCKNLNQRSLTPRWPLTPHLLRSYVWLYPRIIVSKSHENTSKYVDTVTFFAKTWSEGHWPLDDLWPHICWGHTCDSTQGSLCPSPIEIH